MTSQTAREGGSNEPQNPLNASSKGGRETPGPKAWSTDDALEAIRGIRRFADDLEADAKYLR